MPMKNKLPMMQSKIHHYCVYEYGDIKRSQLLF